MRSVYALPAELSIQAVSYRQQVHGNMSLASMPGNIPFIMLQLAILMNGHIAFRTEDQLPTTHNLGSMIIQICHALHGMMIIARYQAKLHGQLLLPV